MNIAVPEEKYSSWLIHRLNHRNIAHSVLGIRVGINTLDVELTPYTFIVSTKMAISLSPSLKKSYIMQHKHLLFTIYDFLKVSEHFKDTDWGGEEGIPDLGC